MDKGKKGKAMFFGFPLTKTGAQIVYVLGILMLIGVGISFLYLVWSIVSISTIYTSYGLFDYGTSFSFMYLIPQLVVEVFLLVLGIYMIKCGKKGM